jgi:hypothetical protein
MRRDDAGSDRCRAGGTWRARRTKLPLPGWLVMRPSERGTPVAILATVRNRSGRHLGDGAQQVVVAHEVGLGRQLLAGGELAGEDAVAEVVCDL